MDQSELGNFFYNLTHPSSYSSIEKLRLASNLPKKQVVDWLAGEDTYTLHKQIRKRFPRNPYMVSNIDSVWELDLVDISKLSKNNKGIKFLFNIIDCFSKFAWSIPIPDKKGTTITKVFKKVLTESRRTPTTVQFDRGKEFLNHSFKSFLISRKIEFHPSRNVLTKCAIVERFNRTQKSIIFKYLSHNNTYKYIDVLDKIMKKYNKSVHSTIGMPPSEVRSKDVYTIWKRLQEKRSRIKRGKIKFKVGDYVRIGKEKSIFSKGYEETFTKEIFKIIKVIPRIPQPVYELEDLQHRVIDGLFYNYELVGITMNADKEYNIDKIIGQRKKNGILEYLVKWKGYDDSFNSYVKASEIRKLKQQK